MPDNVQFPWRENVSRESRVERGGEGRGRGRRGRKKKEEREPQLYSRYFHKLLTRGKHIARNLPFLVPPRPLIVQLLREEGRRERGDREREKESLVPVPVNL